MTGVVAYVPVRLAPQVTVALRAGGQHVAGEFPFYDAAVLGGAGTVRGYPRERFAGRSAASASAEVRAALFDVDAYVLPLRVGALGFVDAGRVWAADLPASLPVNPVGTDALQVGVGGGVWVGLLDRAVVTVSVGVSDESALVTAGLGFAY